MKNFLCQTAVICILVSVAAATCYKQDFIGRACNIGTGLPCPELDGAEICGGWTLDENEDVYTRVSDVPGRETIAKDYLCLIKWKERDADGNCVVNKQCERLVGGFELTGGLCPTGIE